MLRNTTSRQTKKQCEEFAGDRLRFEFTDFDERIRQYLHYGRINKFAKQVERILVFE
jgi:hypothetical protein